MNKSKIIYQLCILWFFSLNSVLFSQWVNLGTSWETLSFASQGNNLYAGGSGIYLSTNFGNNWSNNLLTSQDIINIAFSGNNIFAETSWLGVFFTSNQGLSWTHVNNGLPTNAYYLTSLVVSGNYVFVGTLGGGLFWTTNNGSLWTADTISQTYMDIYTLAVNENRIFASTGNGLFVSTNNGASWSSINNGLPSNSQLILTFGGNDIFAGVLWTNQVFISTNNGASWILLSNIPGIDNNIEALIFSGNNLFASTYRSNGPLPKVFLSTNNGQYWIDKSDNLTGEAFCYMTILDNYIFVSTGAGLWKRSIPELIGIQSFQNNVPEKFSLYQNYPNPFNPSTKIYYDLTVESNVKLIVYDIMGKEVEKIVNTKQNAGKYQVEFDGNNFASGIYFYKLTTGSFTETKKMVLIK